MYYQPLCVNNFISNTEFLITDYDSKTNNNGYMYSSFHLQQESLNKDLPNGSKEGQGCRYENVGYETAVIEKCDVASL